jgi:hypothetical protein
LWDAGENLDAACEGCHLEYWYPNQTALMERLYRRLDELEKHPDKRYQLGFDAPKTSHEK